VLRGAHADPKTACRSCHVPGKKFREARGRCIDCHAKKDVHKGRLGAACANCHTERDWKEARFDHDKTRFPLRGKHAPLKCESCHKSDRYKETPVTCYGCHRKDDPHKALYGEKCESCHGDRDWKTLRFDHDKDTRYALRGRHRTAKCDACHTGHLYNDKLQTGCNACHRKDDKHQGTLGVACGNCHSERDWKVGRFDHAKTRFPLLGKHDAIKCEACHKSAVFKDAPTTCIGCHRKDDKHKGALGEPCGNCHTERNWKESKFDHAKTAFPLLDSHARVKCEACHRDPEYRRTPKDCLGCHKKDDLHQGQLGTKCEAATTLPPGRKRASTTAGRASRSWDGTSLPPAARAMQPSATRTRKAIASPVTTEKTCTNAASARAARPATTRVPGRAGTSITTARPDSRWTGRTAK